MSRKLGLKHAETNTINNLGIAFYGLGKYEKTLEYFLIVHENEGDFDNPQSEARALNNLGIIYHEKSRFDKSIKYYQESLAIK